MSRNRFENYFPFVLCSQFEDLKERFVTVGRRRNQRRLFFDYAVAGDPIEGITPAIFLELNDSAIF